MTGVCRFSLVILISYKNYIKQLFFMENLIKNAKKIVSCLPKTNSFALTEVDPSIKKKLIDLTDNLEKNKKVNLCARGDSMAPKKHKEFFIDKIQNLDNPKIEIHELQKLFIVGEKACAFIEKSPNKAYNHCKDNKKNRKQAITQLIDLIKKTNFEIKNRPDDHKISGEIPDSFIADLVKFDLDLLEKWKIFFLSFLHNCGRPKDFKNYSPFLSLTYGYRKYKTARNFALKYDIIKKRFKLKKGVVFLYCLNIGHPYYLKTNKFTKKLENFGIQWYRDIHSEIMLMNGMFPHYLLGVFEVECNKTPQFIINPWLYKILSSDNCNKFDYINGLPIDQIDFHKVVKTKYKSFFFQTMYGDKQYVGEINQKNCSEVLKPKSNLRNLDEK